MNNLTDLKEQIQEDIMTWHDGLESNHAYPYLEKIISNHGHEPNAWNDMDKLCDIVVDRFKELESKNSKLSPFFEQKL
jgi:myosin-crossreactive antigen